MPKYRKKPVVIEAMQFGGWRNADEIGGWSGAFFVPRGAEHRLRHKQEYDRSNGDVLSDAPEFLVIRTPEGDHRCDVGDWVIRGVQGEFYPCKPDIFEATYEAVADADER